MTTEDKLFSENFSSVMIDYDACGDILVSYSLIRDRLQYQFDKIIIHAHEEALEENSLITKLKNAIPDKVKVFTSSSDFPDPDDEEAVKSSYGGQRCLVLIDRGVVQLDFDKVAKHFERYKEMNISILRHITMYHQISKRNRGKIDYVMCGSERHFDVTFHDFMRKDYNVDNSIPLALLQKQAGMASYSSLMMFDFRDTEVVARYVTMEDWNEYDKVLVFTLRNRDEHFDSSSVEFI